MKHILFPTDFSPVADNALQYALHLADKLGAKLTLMHSHHYSLSETELIPPILMRYLQEEKEINAMEEFRRYEEEIQKDRKNKVPVNHLIRYGFARDQILLAAEELEVDLIVLGTTGASDVVDNILGSVTTSVIKVAACPVLAVPARAQFSGVEHILYATSFEELDMDVFDRLQYFTQRLGARIACLHVHDDRKSWDLVQLDFFNELLRSKIKSEEMEFFLHNDADTARGIEAFMEKNEVDLLAIMPQRRNLFERLFSKSLTRKLSLHSDVPILTFYKESLTRLGDEASDE